MKKCFKSLLTQFGEQNLRSTLLQRDSEKIFDREAWNLLAQTEIFRITVPQSLGGLEMPLSSAVEAFRGLGIGSLDIPFGVSAIAQYIAIDLLVRFGTPEQKQTYLEALMSGTMIAAVCNSETNSGTDIRSIQSSMRVTAEDRATLNVEKRGATNLSHADIFLCSVWTYEEGSQPSLDLLLLESEGALRQSCVDLLAGFKTGMTGSVKILQKEISPGRHRLGEPLFGFKILKHCFNMERLLIGSLMAGVLESILTEALSFIETKSSMNKPLGEFQYVQDKLIQIYSANTKIMALVDTIVEGKPNFDSTYLSLKSKLLSVLKIAIIEDGYLGLNSFFEIFGFVSYTSGHLAQKLVRDHMALRFLGGSKEQQKIVLFSELQRDLSKERGNVSSLSKKELKVNYS